MVEVTTPSKAVSSLVQEGSGHRNPQVRATLGRLLAYVVELFGASKTLNQKDVADKLLPAATKLAQDGSLESRQMAKLIFQRLATQPQFESSLKKYVQSEDVRQIQKFLDNLYSNNSKFYSAIHGTKLTISFIKSGIYNLRDIMMAPLLGP
ncbi:hypothetical protein Avbf_14221 [Armadillidium vulgare]|nr:hypothetical protein Avbf_14221 [Armadillidium vulgare]